MHSELLGIAALGLDLPLFLICGFVHSRQDKTLQGILKPPSRIKEHLQFAPPRLNADPSDFQPDSIDGRVQL
jgi:hypothetical protein